MPNVFYHEHSRKKNTPNYRRLSFFLFRYVFLRVVFFRENFQWCDTVECQWQSERLLIKNSYWTTKFLFVSIRHNIRVCSHCGAVGNASFPSRLYLCFLCMCVCVCASSKSRTKLVYQQWKRGMQENRVCNYGYSLIIAFPFRLYSGWFFFRSTLRWQRQSR